MTTPSLYKLLHESIETTLARIHEIANRQKEEKADQLRDTVIEALTDSIGGDAYDCTRVWSAWSVGTMSNDDFVQVIDRVEEIADAVLNAIVEPVAKIMGEAASAELEDAVAAGARRRALRTTISDLIEDAMIKARVDYPAGREAGPRIEWEEEALLDRIMAVIDPTGIRAAALKLTPDEQYDLANALAANLGYDLTPQPPHPDAPGPGRFEAAAEESFAASGGDTAVVEPEALVRAAPAPNPSPTAKGGDAEALTEAMAFIKRYARHDGNCLTGRDGDYGEKTCECDFNSKRVRLRAKIAALATPSPQPADAVREAVNWSETTLLRYCNEAQAGRYPSDPREFERRVDAAFRTIRAALASDPAPAGEAVEPVETIPAEVREAAKRLRDRHGGNGWDAKAAKENADKSLGDRREFWQAVHAHITVRQST